MLGYLWPVKQSFQSVEANLFFVGQELGQMESGKSCRQSIRSFMENCLISNTLSLSKKGKKQQVRGRGG